MKRRFIWHTRSESRVLGRRNESNSVFKRVGVRVNFGPGGISIGLRQCSGRKHRNEKISENVEFRAEISVEIHGGFVYCLGILCDGRSDFFENTPRALVDARSSTCYRNVAQARIRKVLTANIKCIIFQRLNKYYYWKMISVINVVVESFKSP